jgi:hypothetical protein
MSLVNTLMQSLRTQYPNNLDKNEMRVSEYGAYDFFRQDTNNPNGIMDAETRENIKKSFGNSVVVPVLDAPDVTIGNVRSCTIPDKENTSNLVTLTFATYAFGFTMYPAQYYNNDVKYQADFDRKLTAYLLKFAETLDALCVNVLETNKNTYAGNLAAYYPFTSSSLQIADDEKNDLFNNLNTITREMNWIGKPNIITSYGLFPVVERMRNQGSGNATNDAFQLSGYQNFYASRNITVPGGARAVFYAAENGSVAIENRNDPDAILGHRIGDHMVWEEVDVPIVNLRMASFYREDCTDARNLHSGTANLNRTKKEGFEWSTDIVTMVAYNSDTTNTHQPILKGTLSAT